MLKVDVEGAEPDVLNGAQHLLQRDRPMVLLKCNAWALALHRHDLLEFAESLWADFEPLALYRDTRRAELPADPVAFLHLNMTAHGCVSDLLLRPRV